MMKLEVGDVLQELKGVPDGVRFSMSDLGAELLICFNSPTEINCRIDGKK